VLSLAALALGLGIGLSLGALGGGGSILTVPVLVFLLGLTAQEATTGSLVIVGVTAATAAVSHGRAGNTRWGTGLLLGLAGVPASIVGTAVNRAVAPSVLLLAFAALMVVAATGMLLRARTGPTAEPEPGGGLAVRTRTSVPVVRVALAGLGIGFLTGFLGVGGGFVIVPALVVLLQFPMPVAVGTSLLVIALNSGVALLDRAGGSAHFAWSVIVPFTLAAIAGSVGGKRVAGSVDPRTLTRAFALLLLAVAAYVVAKTLLGQGVG
jgi:uncharacterized membrane protein YfcA